MEAGTVLAASFETPRKRAAPRDDGGVGGELAKRAAWTREVMAAKTVPNKRLTEELLEMANDMRASGVLSKPSYDKIIKRHVISGREAKRASPESIATIGGYGFRARAKKRVPE